MRDHIDLVACFLDVGSSYPGSAHYFRRFGGRAHNSQGWGCTPIKRERELGLDRREFQSGERRDEWSLGHLGKPDKVRIPQMR